MRKFKVLDTNFDLIWTLLLQILATFALIQISFVITNHSVLV